MPVIPFPFVSGVTVKWLTGKPKPEGMVIPWADFYNSYYKNKPVSTISESGE